jgi:hypothetical protein
MNNDPLQRRMFAQQIINQHARANQPMGILASSPQLMGAVQGFKDGGQVVKAEKGKFFYDPQNKTFLDRLLQGEGILRARQNTEEQVGNKKTAGISPYIPGANQTAVNANPFEINRRLVSNTKGDTGGGVDGASTTSSDAKSKIDAGEQVVDLETNPSASKFEDIDSSDPRFINKENKKALDKKKKEDSSEKDASFDKTTVEGNLKGAKDRLAAVTSLINDPTTKEATAVVDKYKTILDEAQAEMNKEGKELTLEEVDKLARPLAGLEDNDNYDDDKHTAFWMALIKGGLATAAGESSNALTNIAKGLSIGVDAYGKDISKLNAQEREDRKALGAARYKIITDNKSAEVALRSAKVQFLQNKASMIQSGDQFKSGMEFKKEQAANINAFKAANLEIAIFKTMNDSKIAGETLDLQKERLANDKDYREKTLNNAIKTLESNERMKLLGDDAKKLLALGDDYATYKDGKYKVTDEGKDLLEIFLLTKNSHKLTDTMEAIKNATESLEVGGFRYKNKADAKKAAFLYYKTTSPAIAKASGGPFGGDAVIKLENDFFKKSGAIGRVDGPTTNTNTNAGDGFSELRTSNE